MRGAEKGGTTAPTAVGMAHLTVQSPGEGAGSKVSTQEVMGMSYKTRARKRQIRKHQKQDRAADKRINRLLKDSRDPQAVGLTGAESDVPTGAPSTAVRVERG